MAEGLNNDRSQFVLMHTASMDWQASPSRGVWRKRLELDGESETSRVTSIVRYEPGSHFPPHAHPGGEEILVLDGVFSDEHGDFPAGSFLLNPEGFAHAPFSVEGCTIFVKLRQYPGAGRSRVVIDGRNPPWRAGTGPGTEFLPLYHDTGHPEIIDLARLASGAMLPAETCRAGAEILILEGELTDPDNRYGKGDWLRFPPGAVLRLAGAPGALFYLKRGHLS